MARDFFHRDIELFIDHRFDWSRYLHLRGVEANVADEVETYKTVLRTTGEVCEDIEAGALDHWHEEVRLESGRVVKSADARSLLDDESVKAAYLGGDIGT